jgi:hypothetical protein
MAVEDCVAKVEFGEVLVCSNQSIGLNLPHRFQQVPDMQSYEEWGLWTVEELPQYLHTEYILHIQYDSWILSAECWQQKFLDFDYIGPPWGWFRDGNNVGCGGFTLYSKELLDRIAAISKKKALQPPYDVAICRTHRAQLEAEGFKWADLNTALDFGFERTGFRGRDYHFGFHGMFNWSLVLDREPLAKRLALCSEYHLKKRDALPKLTSILGEANTARVGELLREFE